MRLVFYKIVTVFFLILAGWLARRRGWLHESANAALSRIITSATFPALVLVHLSRSVDGESLRQDWLCPALGIVILGIGQIIGALAGRRLAAEDERPTFIFLVAIGNWIFLPLVILEALFPGGEGVRAILLFNIGCQIYLWTIGVWTLQGRQAGRSGALGFLNGGFIATLLGIGLGLAAPGLRTVYPLTRWEGSAPLLLGGAIYDALNMLGSLTIPLSMLLSGAQLSVQTAADTNRRTLLSVIVLRLAATPFACLLLLRVLNHFLPLPPATYLAAAIVSAMPVAVSCTPLAERFGGRPALAAQSVFYSTLASLVTVPIFYAFAVWLAV